MERKYRWNARTDGTEMKAMIERLIQSIRLCLPIRVEWNTSSGRRQGRSREPIRVISERAKVRLLPFVRVLACLSSLVGEREMRRRLRNQVLETPNRWVVATPISASRSPTRQPIKITARFPYIVLGRTCGIGHPGRGLSYWSGIKGLRLERQQIVSYEPNFQRVFLLI